MKKEIQIIIIVVVILIFIVISYLIIDRQVIPHGPYETSINRNYHNESEEELISIAENIEPPDGKWWFDEFDNIKLADCVNIEAIEYYSDLIHKIKGDHDFTGIDIKNANFTYNANVIYFNNNGKYNTTYEELIEVNLTISFSEYCGSLCGVWFEHYRIVIFNYESDIILVRGDDIQPQVMVS
jgi:hypothetical protein